jgi:hypothetical protein
MEELSVLYSDHKAMQEQLADVTERHRTAKSSLDAAIEDLKTEWSRRNSELVGEFQEITQLAAIKDKQLRDATIDAYKANPTSKTVAAGLSVRINTSLNYDAAKALEWAKAHDLALALDKKAFETIAKAQAIDFVETVEIPTAVVKL